MAVEGNDDNYDIIFVDGDYNTDEEANEDPPYKPLQDESEDDEELGCSNQSKSNRRPKWRAYNAKASSKDVGGHVEERRSFEVPIIEENEGYQMDDMEMVLQDSRRSLGEATTVCSRC